MAIPKYMTCYYCKTTDTTVEAGGLWYCPVEWCSGPAGGQRRHVEGCTNCRKSEDINGRITIHKPCLVLTALWAQCDASRGRDVAGEARTGITATGGFYFH